ncbi:hypothetical protein [Kribbella sindirgiensis]|uniref:Uncharacterized protein n=1 Tax=Kribbella sindirgiensis TaxID=1124744 RepID=A0A4R0I2T4_9ACTN|nr:hypothetical protein [Kribbella sindirgiensis]TCC21283.1 hypothetical protein E0H50_36190 [Kribbella sindirgiensis]
MNLADIVRTEAALRQLAVRLGSEYADAAPGHVVRLVTKVAQGQANAGHRGWRLIELTELEVRERLLTD